MSVFSKLTLGIFSHSDEGHKDDSQENNVDVLKKDTQGLDENYDPVEESWEFLVHITEKILNDFSEEQKNKLLAVGRSLHRTGATYNHIVYNAEKIKK